MIKFMTRQEAEKRIQNTYSTEPDYPWEKYGEQHAVYRHRVSRKWYGLLMDVSAQRLGYDSQEIISVLNLKLPLSKIEEAKRVEGIHPAYHMSKKYWVSVELRKIDERMLDVLVELSFQATAMKKDL